MFAHIFPSRPANGRAALVALLVIVCFVALVAPLGAAEMGEAGMARATPAPLAFIGDILGNRTRMIQIACVIGAIGIFWLTRSIK